jgi:hypothetical protein
LRGLWRRWDMSKSILRAVNLLVGVGFLFACGSAQAALLFSITNKAWRFEQERNMDRTGWQTPAFSALDWNEGLGLFGFDSNAEIEPLIQTQLFPPSIPAPGLMAPRTYYFRTYFEYVHGDFTIPVLVFSNRVDDGAVFYLNGEEIQRIRMDDGEVTYTNLANRPPPPGDATEWDVFYLRNPNLRSAPQVNWLAVEVHQVSGSGDVVFGCQLYLDYVPLLQLHPQHLVVLECRTATLELLFGPSQPATYQWFKDGVPINPALNPTATNSALTITNARRVDAGQYYLVMSNSYGAFTSDVATLMLSPDVSAPAILAAMATSNLTEIRIVLSEPVLQSGNLAMATISNVCGGPGLEISQVREIDPTNILLITTARELEQSYVFFLEADQIHDACAGNPNATTLRPISGTIPRMTITTVSESNLLVWQGCGRLQQTTNLFDWSDVPGNPASPYPVVHTVPAQFYRLRVP